MNSKVNSFSGAERAVHGERCEADTIPNLATGERASARTIRPTPYTGTITCTCIVPGAVEVFQSKFEIAGEKALRLMFISILISKFSLDPNVIYVLKISINI